MRSRALEINRGGEDAVHGVPEATYAGFPLDGVQSIVCTAGRYAVCKQLHARALKCVRNILFQKGRGFHSKRKSD